MPKNLNEQLLELKLYIQQNKLNQNSQQYSVIEKQVDSLLELIKTQGYQQNTRITILLTLSQLVKFIQANQEENDEDESSQFFIQQLFILISNISNESTLFLKEQKPKLPEYTLDKSSTKIKDINCQEQIQQLQSELSYQKQIQETQKNTIKELTSLITAVSQKCKDNTLVEQMQDTVEKYCQIVDQLTQELQNHQQQYQAFQEKVENDQEQMLQTLAKQNQYITSLQIENANHKKIQQELLNKFQAEQSKANQMNISKPFSFFTTPHQVQQKDYVIIQSPSSVFNKSLLQQTKGTPRINKKLIVTKKQSFAPKLGFE